MEKIAIVDLGSSKIDLILANVLPTGNFAVFEEMSETVKIVNDFDGEGLLRIARSNEALTILKMYKMVCEVNKITNIIAVGSHNLKNLKNYKSFLDEIYNTCGFKFKLMTEEEELNVLYNGVVNSLDMPKGVIFNISGGSTRIVQYNRRNILNQIIIPFGAYTIAKAMDEISDPAKACEKMTQNFAKELEKIDWLKNIEPEYSFVGVGNSFVSTGMLSRKIRKYSLDAPHNYVMSEKDLNNVYDLVKTLDIDKTKKIKGLPAERSDVFAAGVCMIKSVFDVCKFENTTVSTKGMNEGLIYTSVVPGTNEKPISDLLGFSLENIKTFYDSDYNNSKQVSELALILFRQLKVLHKLPRGYIKVLRIAASMHDCGQRIKFYDHEKNSFHVILNSEVLGATHREIILAAFASSSQNLSDFSLTEWIKYKDLLLEEDLDAVRKLSLIVRLAEALDKTHRGVVQDISCDILGDSVIMKTIVTIDASIEIREALKSSQDFKKVYKKTLEVL